LVVDIDVNFWAEWIISTPISANFRCLLSHRKYRRLACLVNMPHGGVCVSRLRWTFWSTRNTRNPLEYDGTDHAKSITKKKRKKRISNNPNPMKRKQTKQAIYDALLVIFLRQKAKKQNSLHHI
jgi:hypothetical protein